MNRCLEKDKQSSLKFKYLGELRSKANGQTQTGSLLTLFSRPKNNPLNVDVGYFWTPKSM